MAASATFLASLPRDAPLLPSTGADRYLSSPSRVARPLLRAIRRSLVVCFSAGTADLAPLPSSASPILERGAVGSERRKTKIVCTIGPSTSSREMIWRLADSGMNVARLNMSHGDHASHQRTIDYVKEYNAKAGRDNVVAIILDTKGPEVRSGDLPQPIMLTEGQEFCFTIKRGVSSANTVSVNYDDFMGDVDVGDIILVDGGLTL